MRKLFKVEWDSKDSGLQLKWQSGNPLCSWSTRNLVAFTTGHVESVESMSWRCTIFVHIMCPEYPWEVYHIKVDVKDVIEHLLWDQSSTRLIVIDSTGSCKLFGMRKSFINCWEIIHEVCLDSKIVCASWLGPGSKHIFDAKAGHANLLEKFAKRLVKSTLADIAGLSRDGFIAVTETGIANVALLEKGTKVLKVQKAKLFANRCRILHGDIKFKEDGKVYVVLATDKRVVEFFVLSLRLVNMKVEIQVEISPCIIPHVISDEEYMTYHVSCVKFSNEVNADKVLVCTESGLVTCLKLFELKIEKASLQPVLQRMAQNPKVINVKEWMCSKSITLQGHISCMSLTRMISIVQSTSDIPLCPSMLFATKEGKLHIISSSLSNATNIEFSYQEERIMCLTYSPCDTCVLAVTDGGNVSVFQAVSFDSVADRVTLKTCVNLFEYCLVTGISSWGVAIIAAGLGDKYLEQCSQLLRSNLLGQPSMTQERMSASYTQIQAEIYKSLDGLYFGTVESYNFLMLKSIYCFFHSTINLQSADREAQLLLKLKTLCSRQLDIDLPKIIQILEVKDLQVNATLIASLQHQIQWIASYSMHVCRLVLATIKRANFKQVVSMLSIQGLKILRELLALIYIWGQSCPGWQPHFIEQSNPSDIINHLFKFVSKLCLKLMQNDISKDNMNEDDIPMRGHPFMYQVSPFYDPKCGTISQCKYQDCDYYTFSPEEETISSGKQFTFPHPMEQGSVTILGRDYIFDAINLIQTSVMKGETLKQCIQCSCLTLSIADSSRTLQPSWKEQWIDACFCGGFWRALDIDKETDVVQSKGASSAEVKSS